MMEMGYREALKNIVSYNGWSDLVVKLAAYIVTERKLTPTISFPPMLGSMDCDLFPRVLWSMLVLMYGDYGTSPRYGWLRAENAEEVLKELDYLYDEEDEA